MADLSDTTTPTTANLTARDQEILINAWHCLKTDTIPIDYEKLAERLSLKNRNVACAVWGAVKKKLFSEGSSGTIAITSTTTPKPQKSPRKKEEAGDSTPSKVKKTATPKTKKSAAKVEDESEGDDEVQEDIQILQTPSKEPAKIETSAKDSKLTFKNVADLKISDMGGVADENLDADLTKDKTKKGSTTKKTLSTTVDIPLPDIDTPAIPVVVKKRARKPKSAEGDDAADEDKPVAKKPRKSPTKKAVNGDADSVTPISPTPTIVKKPRAPQKSTPAKIDPTESKAESTEADEAEAEKARKLIEENLRLAKEANDTVVRAFLKSKNHPSNPNWGTAINGNITTTSTVREDNSNGAKTNDAVLEENNKVDDQDTIIVASD